MAPSHASGATATDHRAGSAVTTGGGAARPLRVPATATPADGRRTTATAAVPHSAASAAYGPTRSPPATSAASTTPVPASGTASIPAGAYPGQARRSTGTATAASTRPSAAPARVPA